MKHVFLSYAHEDKPAVRQIAMALEESSLKVWFDENKLRSGDVLIKEIAAALQKADVVCVVLTPTALTKPWVLEEMQMARTAEIEHGRPRVVALLLQDCEVPPELRPKLYIDFRRRFDAAIEDLRNQIAGIDSAPSIPKQAVIAAMMRKADDELWARLAHGAESEWSRPDFADLVQSLSSRELEGAVAMGSSWPGQACKQWEDRLIRVLNEATGTSGASARGLLQALVTKGFLEPATDREYRPGTEPWCATSALWILCRAARRSGLFPKLPPPIPERLSAVLAYDRALIIAGKGWYATRFAEPVKTDLDRRTLAIVAVVRHDPPTTWVFRSGDDRRPLTVERCYTVGELTPGDPSASSCGEERDELWPGFGLSVFDDIGLLTG